MNARSHKWSRYKQFSGCFHRCGPIAIRIVAKDLCRPRAAPSDFPNGNVQNQRLLMTLNPLNLLTPIVAENGTPPPTTFDHVVQNARVAKVQIKHSWPFDLAGQRRQAFQRSGNMVKVTHSQRQLQLPQLGHRAPEMSTSVRTDDCSRCQLRSCTYSHATRTFNEPNKEKFWMYVPVGI